MKKSIQILLLCFLVLIFLCIVFGDYLLPFIPRDVRTSKVHPLPPRIEEISQSSTQVHSVLPQPSASGTKPCFLTLNGAPVFGEGFHAEELLKNVSIVVKFRSPIDDVFSVKASVLAAKKITWSSPKYQFFGYWENMDGELVISGHYESTNDATELPSKLQNLGTIRFLVTECSFGKGYPPYTISLSLWLKRIPKKETNP